jgi:preprotein translocase subunit SecA
MHKNREAQVGVDAMRQIEKYAYLGSIDHHWIDHIDAIDDLRNAIGLRAYGQRDPLVEFKGEAYEMFESLLQRIDEEVARRIFRIGVNIPQSEIPTNLMRENVDTKDGTGLTEKKNLQTPKSNSNKLGRNDPCFCGSGKKWKKCHFPKLG